MTYRYPNTLPKQINSLIDKAIRNLNKIDVYIVTDVNEENYTVGIKHLNFEKLSYTNVPILGIGLGNFKGGVMKLPDVNDFVLIGFIGSKDNKPVVLGTLYDVFTGQGDVIPKIRQNELFLSNAEKGSFLVINKDNDIIIRTAEVGGDLSKGAKIRFKSDGSMKIFNSKGFGLELDANGNATMRCATFRFTKTAGE